MMVLISSRTGEVELSGSRAELVGLAEVLRAGAGEVGLDQVSDPSPYDGALRRVVVSVAGQSLASVGVEQVSSVLAIAGGRQALSLLGDNLESFAAESDGGADHLHIEYFADHYYLSSGSTPLVVALSD